MTTETINAWTWFEPQETDAIAAIREEINAVTPDHFNPETDPHVSILPGFELPVDAPDGAVEDVLEAGKPHLSDEIRVTGISTFHPLDADDPTFVVKLDVEAPGIEDARAAMCEKINEIHGDEGADNMENLLYPPTPAHITLAKSGDGGDDELNGLTEKEANTLRSEMENLTEESSFTLSVGHGAGQF